MEAGGLAMRYVAICRNGECAVLGVEVPAEDVAGMVCPACGIPVEGPGLPLMEAVRILCNVVGVPAAMPDYHTEPELIFTDYDRELMADAHIRL